MNLLSPFELPAELRRAVERAGQIEEPRERLLRRGAARADPAVQWRRRSFKLTDPRLNDRVADNVHRWEITESETLLFGRNFGVSTDVQTGPNGNLFVVSLTDGAVYEVFDD